MHQLCFIVWLVVGVSQTQVASSQLRRPGAIFVDGQCQLVSDRGEGYNSLTCTGPFSGSFNSTAAGLNSLADCAQFAKEACGDKAAFVSYLKSADDCKWFSAAQCGCATRTPTDCPETGYTTGEISKLLTLPLDSGHDVATLDIAGDASVERHPSFTIDSNAMMSEAEDMPVITAPPTILSPSLPTPWPSPVPTNDVFTELRTMLSPSLPTPYPTPEPTVTPDHTELRTILSPAELDEVELKDRPHGAVDAEKSLRESTVSVWREGSRKIIGHEQKDCPDELKIAVHRGEWMCIKKRALSSFVVRTIMMVGCAVILFGAFVAHYYGSLFRSAPKHVPLDPDSGWESDDLPALHKAAKRERERFWAERERFRAEQESITAEKQIGSGAQRKTFTQFVYSQDASFPPNRVVFPPGRGFKQHDEPLLPPLGAFSQERGAFLAPARANSRSI